MLKLLSLSAIASSLVLAAATSTPASAGHFGGHFSGGHGGGYHFHGGHFARGGHPGSHFPGHRYHWGHVHYHHGWHRWHHWHGWAAYGPVYGVGGYTAAATGPAPVCTCLTKEYLDDGAVRFIDNCTKETAIAAPVPGPRG